MSLLIDQIVSADEVEGGVRLGHRVNAQGGAGLWYPALIGVAVGTILMVAVHGIDP